MVQMDYTSGLIIDVFINRVVSVIVAQQRRAFGHVLVGHISFLVLAFSNDLPVFGPEIRAEPMQCISIIVMRYI